MKILLLGKNGQVGWELQRSLAPLGDLVCFDRANGGDLGNLPAIKALIKNHQPDIVVNAAAYTNVDGAEDKQDQADLINHLAVRAIAGECKAQGAVFIHYSTDYVYAGDGDIAWCEDSPVGPQNQYGISKLNGEAAIEQSGCKFYIFRTSWVYGSVGSNFIKTMLRLTKERDTLSVVSDQIGAPTGAALIADITALLIQTRKYKNVPTGVYHLAAAGETSWQEYTQYIIHSANAVGMQRRCTEVQVTGVTSSEYPQKATRPKNSRLSLSKLEKALSIEMPPWQQGVAHVVTELNLLKAVD